MGQFELTLDERGVDHVRAELARYLPGLDPGLTVLSRRTVLLPQTTLRSIALAYGRDRVAPVLREAGVIGERPIADAEALDLMLHRDPAALPARPAAPPGSRLWHLDEVDVRAAWNHWGGPEQVRWLDVRVGQIDTGYTAHAAFGFPGGSWIDTAGGRTFFAGGAGEGGAGPGGGVDPVQAAMDGHGTRVGSVIAGFDAAAPGGAFLGIAPRVPMVPVRIANHVLISHAQRELAEALRYLVRDARVAVVNLSMGFLPRFQVREVDRAIDEAYEAGVIFVCAAGQPLSSVVSPAHGRRTIAAAGSTIGHIPWSSSAHGPAVDWAAPAEFIFRADANAGGGAAYRDNGDGTSYAAAISSGAAALWLARHGERIAAEYPLGWQRVEAFKAVAKATATPMPHQQPGSFGAGILNIAKLLAAALPAASVLRPEKPA